MVSVQFRKKFKGLSFCVGWSEILKLSRKTLFLLLAFMCIVLNVLSSFALFSSICYQDDLSDSERNEIASSTAGNFNNT